VLDAEGVRVALREPRHFIEHAGGTFDLVQLVTLEGTAAGSGGIGGLSQDHLVTVEGLAACLEAVSGEGMVVACRGIQTPPRDNIKLLATFVAALRRLDVRDPGAHIVVLRDYLAVCTMVRPTPWNGTALEEVRALCRARQLTPVWFDGIADEELNRPDALPGPPDGPGDWFHHAAVRLVTGEAEAAAFIDSWHFDVRPPTDDRPFFLDFCRLGSLGALRAAFGDHWLTRSELAFPFVLGATLLIAVAAAFLTVVPLPWLGLGARGRRTSTALYFAAIGLAYLLLEMTLLSRLSLLIGDPTLTAAMTIASFLCFSGAGCLTAQRWTRPRRGGVQRLLAALLCAGVAVLVSLPPLVHLAGSWPLIARVLVAVLITAPLAYLMGFPMPLGLARLERGGAALIPWAWSINGFASVLASPLAMALGMASGFTWAAVLGLVLYGCAAAVFARLPE
jgi:hypothetical protein